MAKTTLNSTSRIGWKPARKADGEPTRAAKIKTTIGRTIEKGRLSATRQPDGSYEIDPAELHRAFPNPGDGSGTMARSVTASDTGELRVEVEMLRERLVEKDDVIGDLRQRLDQSEAERRQAQERLTALLTNQRPAPRRR